MPKGRQQAASFKAIMRKKKLYALQHSFLSFLTTVFKAVSAFSLGTRFQGLYNSVVKMSSKMKLGM